MPGAVENLHVVTRFQTAQRIPGLGCHRNCAGQDRQQGSIHRSPKLMLLCLRESMSCNGSAYRILPPAAIRIASGGIMERVTGIGGVFFKSPDPERLLDWYEKHLGFKRDPGSGGASVAFRWRDDQEGDGMTVWSIFPEDTTYFQPS